MGQCLSITKLQVFCFQRSFARAGLRSCTTDLGDGTVVHCWVPKIHVQSKPTLLMIHGFGGNALFHYKDFIPHLNSEFNLYIPDLLFFGESYTTRFERSEHFQAQCMMGLIDAVANVSKIDLIGMSYGGIVAYSMAAQFSERVRRVTLLCSGVSFEAKDMEDGMLSVKSVEEAASILVPQTPEKVRQALQMSLYNPPRFAPDFLLNDFIKVMCTEYCQEKRELLYALFKDRKLSNLPKITQPTLLIWGEYDKIFPLELGHRLKRHIGENSELVIIKNTGHGACAEKPKEMFKHLLPFLMENVSSTKQGTHSNGIKAD